MNLGELEEAINYALQDPSMKQFVKDWLNNAILELAASFDLPGLRLRTPATLPITEDAWIFDLPADFQKNLFRCADENMIEIRRYRTFEALDRLDLDHSDIGDRPTAIAWEEGGESGNQIGVYPKATNTINLWYFKKPPLLKKPGDVPTCIPEPFHHRVIIPKVVIRGLEHMQDQVENFDPRALQLWNGKLAAGLRGSPTDGPGMIHYLSRNRGGSRRHGGRDPVGARYYA